MPHTQQSASETVSEAVYWRDYYELSEPGYEWNNGYLEEKPVSDYQTYLVYRWFTALLEFYLQTCSVARFTGLEMGFRLALPNKTTIRKPDLGVVLDSNPVPLQLEDTSYHGIFDICVEALSDSEKSEIERDTVVKKAEYAAAGVKEYFILHDHDKHLAFYRLSQHQTYLPIMPQNGVIHSEVLPGFQFRMKDLFIRPGVVDMLQDSVYQPFVLPTWQRERAQLQHEINLRDQAEKRAEDEARQRRQAEAEIARLQALLENK